MALTLPLRGGMFSAGQGTSCWTRLRRNRFLRAVEEIQVQVFKTKGEIGADGHLRVDVAVELPAGPVELVMVLGGVSASNGATLPKPRRELFHRAKLR